MTSPNDEIGVGGRATTGHAHQVPTGVGHFEGVDGDPGLIEIRGKPSPKVVPKGLDDIVRGAQE